MNTGTGSQTGGNRVNKIQDEQDMAMLDDLPEGSKIYATVRYACKSTAFISLLNKFGEEGGFENLLTLIAQP